MGRVGAVNDHGYAARATARAGRPTRRLLAAVVVAGVVVAGCGNSGDDGDAATTTAAPDASDATATTAAGDAGGDTREFQPIEGVPGVTDTEIRYTAIGTGASNPTGACGLDCYVQGIEAYFAFRNSEGGIYGRQLVLNSPVDDELANNQVRSLEVIENNDAFGVFQIPLLASGFADLANAGVPLYTTLISATDVAGQESSFATYGARCPACGSPTAVRAAQLGGATRVALLGYGISQISKDCVAGGVRALEDWGADLGIEVAYVNDDLAFGLPNGVGPEVTAMRQAGVDYISGCLDGNATTIIAQELERQGMSDVTMLAPGDGYGSPTFLESADLFEDDLMIVTFRPFESNIEGTGAEDFLQWIEETGDDDTDLGYAMFGWLNADLAYQGLVAAGPQFDRASVIAATNALEDYTADGLISAYDPGREHVPPTVDDLVTNGPGLDCLTMLRITSGGYELVTGTRDAPWECFDLADVAANGYSEPEPTNFE